MEVTKNNFRQALTEIKSLLKDADFISFDVELTGLGNSPDNRYHELDTPEERYQKAMLTAKEYGLIQIGVAIFRQCMQSRKFLSSTYTFFLSGNEAGSYRYDSASMMFLAKNGFDFNKLFLEGLTFMSLEEETEILKKRDLKLSKEMEISSPSPIKIRDAGAKKFYKEALRKMAESIEKKEELIFESVAMNGFFKKILFCNVAPMFPSSFFQHDPEHKRNVKVTHFETENDKTKYMHKSWEEELHEKLGFTHVVKAILESNKPLVGHNMVLDLLHFVDKFVTSLPSDLTQFKDIMKTALPTVYDTKLFAKDPPFSGTLINTALEVLYKELTSKYSPPEFDTEADCQSYSISGPGQIHNGGYDAFMTGVCFVIMIKTLERNNWRKFPLMNSKHLQNYANKINFMGSYDIPYIDLFNSNVIPNRNYIYSISCPSTWKSDNVRHVFASFKGYRIAWVNDTHLYVIPQDEGDISRASTLLQTVRALCSPNVKVHMYDQAKRISNGVNDLRKAKYQIKNPNRPSNINLKRPSDNNNESNDDDTNIGDVSAVSDDPPRNLKRLKSVGSELLSNMTLQSPMNDDKELPSSSEDPGDSLAKASKTSEVFQVPDEW